MTWNIGDGFDFWATNADASVGSGAATWDSFAFNNGIVGSANTRFSVGQCLDLYYAGSMTKSVSNNDQVHHVVMALKRTGTTSSQCITSYTFFDGTSAQCTVAFLGDGSIKLYSGTGASGNGSGTVPSGSVLTTFSGAVSANTYVGIEVEVCISSTAGYMNVRINGDTVNDFSSATTLNTRNGSSNNYANKITLWDHGGSYNAGAHSYLDDFIWFTTAGSVPNTWVGDVRAVQQMPTSDSSVQMTPNSGTNNYSRINQTVEDGDTSYVSSATAGQIDLYGLPALATVPASIVAVVTKLAAKKTDAGTRQARVRTSSGGTVTTGGTYALSTSYGYTCKVDTVDPNTSAAWTPTAVGSYIIGIELVA